MLEPTKLSMPTHGVKIMRNVLSLAACVCDEDVVLGFEPLMTNIALKRDGFVEVPYAEMLGLSRALLMGFKKHGLLGAKLISMTPTVMKTTPEGDATILRWIGNCNG